MTLWTHLTGRESAKLRRQLAAATTDAREAAARAARLWRTLRALAQRTARLRRDLSSARFELVERHIDYDHAVRLAEEAVQAHAALVEHVASLQAEQAATRAEARHTEDRLWDAQAALVTARKALAHAEATSAEWQRLWRNQVARLRNADACLEDMTAQRDAYRAKLAPFERRDRARDPRTGHFVGRKDVAA